MIEKKPNPKAQAAAEAARVRPVYYFILDGWKREELPDEATDDLLCELYQCGRPVFLKDVQLPLREIGWLIATVSEHLLPYPLDQAPLVLTTEELAVRIEGREAWV